MFGCTAVQVCDDKIVCRPRLWRLFQISPYVVASGNGCYAPYYAAATPHNPLVIPSSATALTEATPTAQPTSVATQPCPLPEVPDWNSSLNRIEYINLYVQNRLFFLTLSPALTFCFRLSHYLGSMLRQCRFVQLCYWASPYYIIMELLRGLYKSGRFGCRYSNLNTDAEWRCRCYEDWRST